MGTCVSCNVDGAAGDGTAQGTCPSDLKCHKDGSCSVCSSEGLAGTDTEPHSGCTSINPQCNSDGTECQCDTTTPTICDASASSTCDATGMCKCGTNEQCKGNTPICNTMEVALNAQNQMEALKEIR